MKKIIFSLIGILIILGIVFIPSLFKKDDKLTKVKVAEVAHSIFYAPQYIADSLGYFEEEGLDVEIILTSGADKVTAAVLSGDVQIGFSGSEATIYVVVGWGGIYLARLKRTLLYQLVILLYYLSLAF